jgi:hypothetical protein
MVPAAAGWLRAGSKSSEDGGLKAQERGYHTLRTIRQLFERYVYRFFLTDIEDARGSGSVSVTRLCG